MCDVVHIKQPKVVNYLLKNYSINIKYTNFNRNLSLYT
jgi:hypothetical protein